MDTAEYDDADNLLEEPSFKWWSSKVLENKDRIIYRVKPRYCRKTQKFDIDLPHYVEEVYNIDEEN